jgi:dipeptidyl aminopeptidase/acylaminoacyl peptidase
MQRGRCECDEFSTERGLLPLLVPHSLTSMRILPLLIAAASLLPFSAAAADSSDTPFLDFPYVDSVSAAKVPAFAWLSRQADKSMIFFARAPDFRRIELATRSDEGGDPISAVQLSPDGTHIVYETGVPRPGEPFNPGSMVPAPSAKLWLMPTRAGAKPVDLGSASEPSFTPDGSKLLFKRDADLWIVDTRAPGAKPKLFAKGGGDWSQFVWTKSGDLIFVDDRRGYSFLGRFHPGSNRVDWLETGVDRLAVPVLSPSEDAVAVLRFPGRKHSTTPDQTEAEPFSIDLVDLASGGVRTLWSTRGPAITLGNDDPEGALRWTSNDQLVFYSEDDNWGRLYALSRNGGAPRAITPPNCEVAESEKTDAGLLVIHNCANLDTRQISLFDPATGAARALPQGDPVLADARAAGDYAAIVAADPNQAPLLRILDLRTNRPTLNESYSDYGYRPVLAGAPPVEVHLTSLDGLPFTGQLFAPSGPGPHPGLIYVHGGPQRQMFPSFHYMGYYASDYAVNRRLAEQGYAVLAINYRSGIGYGRAFRDAPGRAWRDASEYRDVLAAGRWLAAQPGVDASKIGIWGGSYGGLLTGQALARNSDLFKTGVGIHGVYDWSWPSPVKGHLSPSTYFGVDKKDEDLARANSPVGHVDTWRSPVLLIHGDQDMNVDVVETVDLAQRLRERGVEVRTLIFPGEAHDFIRHAEWQKVWRALDPYLLEKLPPPR